MFYIAPHVQIMQALKVKLVEQALQYVKAWPDGGIPGDHARGRAKEICSWSNINLESNGARDLWQYCHIKRGASWYPKGYWAWQYRTQSYILVECWLFAQGCSSDESESPYTVGSGGLWWPALVGAPANEFPARGVLPYTCPDLAAKSAKCWGCHWTRLRLRDTFVAMQQQMMHIQTYAPPPPPPPLPALPAPQAGHPVQHLDVSEVMTLYAESEVSEVAPSTISWVAPSTIRWVAPSTTSWVAPSTTSAASIASISTARSASGATRRWNRRRADPAPE